MIGFLQCLAGGLVVVALSAIDPSNARWFALAFAAVLFMATLPIRRVQPSAEDGGEQSKEKGSSV